VHADKSGRGPGFTGARAGEEQGNLFAVQLHCPYGGPLHYKLLQRRPELAGRFPQPEDDSWVSDLE